MACEVRFGSEGVVLIVNSLPLLGGIMRCRFVLYCAAVVAAFLVVPSRGAAQEVDVKDSPGARRLYRDALFFSKDALRLREFQLGSLEGERYYRVSVVTYDVRTGAVLHVLDQGEDSRFLSATTDGRIALISFHGGVEKARHVVRLDVETGRQEGIPAQWFGDDHRPDEPYATISGDGRLIGAYSETGPPERPRVLTLYDWQTKKRIAQRSTGFPAGGISWGDVTVDGKISFQGNRGGGEVVDPKTGRRLTGVGPNTYRSPDGAWDVDFPNPMFDAEQATTITDGMTGIVVGKLEGSGGNNTAAWTWGRGGFCGTSGRFAVARVGIVEVFEIPSGKRIAEFPAETWRGERGPDVDAPATVGCSADGKGVAIRSAERLTIHRLP